MPFQEIADKEQLATLQAVLNEICMAVGIAPESPEGDGAAGLLLHLHKIGCRTPDELKTTFEKVSRYV